MKDKINFLNKECKTNWEIRFHGDYVDINYPDSPVTPDYEDYKSLDMALDEVIKDLLAQKEDRKEEQPCNNFKPASNDEGYETTKYPHQCPICKGWRGFCLNCNKDHHENGWDSCNSTPSPLEGFEEIEEVEEYFNRGELSTTINLLIRNQKKLYQYIKEKK